MRLLAHLRRTTSPGRSARRGRSALRVRHLAAGEEHVVRQVLDGLSDRSRTLRFHRPLPRVGDDLVRQLARVDGDRTVLVAERWTGSGWQPVGVGHLLPDGPGVLELGVAVVDAHQGRGVGRRLVGAMAEIARASDHDRLVAHVLADNAPMLRLLRQEFPMVRTRHAGDGTIHLQAELGAWTLSTDDVLGDLMVG